MKNDVSKSPPATDLADLTHKIDFGAYRTGWIALPNEIETITQNLIKKTDIKTLKSDVERLFDSLWSTGGGKRFQKVENGVKSAVILPYLLQYGRFAQIY